MSRPPSHLSMLQRLDRVGLAHLADEDPSRFIQASSAELAQVIDLLQQGGTAEAEERAILKLLYVLEPLARAYVLRLLDLGDDRLDLVHLFFEDCSSKM